MRFRVYSFRGYEDYVFYDFAYGAAIKLIDGVKADGFSDEYWWACIHDQHKGVKMIVWLRGNYCYQKTQWLKL